MRIARVTDVETLVRGAALYDGQPQPAASARFLASPDHHLLYAFDDDDDDQVVGFVSGVETTHPDNPPALATYRGAGATAEEASTVLVWTF